MHIGIDGYEANTPKRVGIGQYAFQLLTHISRLDQKNSYLVFLPTPQLPDLPPPSANWRYVVGQPGALWTLWQLPQLIRRNPVDLFFSPTHYVPWFTHLPKVFSIMDLSFIHFPSMFKLRDCLQLNYLTWYSVKQARKIFTISEFTKTEIVKHYGFPKEDVVVTYPGINISVKGRSFLGRKNIKQRLNILGINKKFILFVGTLQPRKNLIRLIKAYEQLKQDVQLVLVGKKGWLYEPIFKAIAKSQRRDQILTLDFVSEADLQTLYKGAACFVLPSLYEGFGIPVVEAMDVGCPVVVSQTSSLPEVAGEAGIYIDPQNTDDIARGLQEALQLKPAVRQELITKGQAQAKKFSWEMCAKRTLEVFHSL